MCEFKRVLTPLDRKMDLSTNIKSVEDNIWVCLKIGYIPNEIAIFHRDNDH